VNLPFPSAAAWRRCTIPLLVAALCACTPGSAQAPDPGPPMTRILILVRHGQYDHHDKRGPVKGRGLVDLGREQTKLLSERLLREGWTFDSMHVSTFRRARETADILAETLHMKPNVVADLSECTPGTRRQDVMEDLERGEAEACEAQLDRVRHRFFRPARGKEGRDLLVCHGNVIRYLVCAALGVDTEAWLEMRIANTGITEIEIKPDGDTRVVTFNDVGHLPPEMRSMTGRDPRPAAGAAADSTGDDR